MLRLRLAVSAFAACVLLLGLGSQAASADQTLDPVVQDNIDSVTQYIAAESGATALPCDTTCDALINDLRRPPTAPKDPIPARIWKLITDKARTAIKPPWKLPRGGLLNPAYALVGLNYYVWKVKVLGARPRAYLVKVPTEAFTIEDVSGWVFSDGTYDPGFLTYHEKPNPMPVGLVARSSDRAAVLWHTGGWCSDAGPSSTPWYVNEITWYWNDCWMGYKDGHEWYEPMTAHGWWIDLDELISWDDAASTPDSPDTYEVDGVELTEEELRQRIIDLLSSDDPDYDLLEQWINSVAGGGQPNPRAQQISAPSCGSASVTQCRSDLRDAGFSGPIETSVIDSEDAVMEKPAGALVDSEPALDGSLPVNQPFKLYVNPDPMPTMTATELAIADDLESLNPDQINATNRRTIARRCVKNAIAAGNSANDCTSVPILVQGSDIRVPAQNELAALSRNPAWFVLNRREPPNRANPPWYFDRGQPAPGCVRAARPPGDSCDEFPFWSTLQAYGGTLNGNVDPSIRWAPSRQQDRQRTVLSAFYSACAIVPQAATDVAPTPASTFLNVATPYGVPSTRACNR